MERDPAEAVLLACACVAAIVLLTIIITAH